MSFDHHNRKRMVKKQSHLSIFTQRALLRNSLSGGRRGLRIEPLEDRRLLAVDMVTSNLDDSSAGTLRSVLAAAASGDTIEFDSSITQIDLTQGALEIDKDLTVEGPGASAITINQTGFYSVFQIDAADANNDPVAVSMSGLTLTGGDADNGGAFLNFGNLSLDAMTLSDNAGAYGGAIDNLGTLTLADSTLSGNLAEHGGGLANLGTATVVDCTISGNSAGQRGGGIYSAVTLTVSGSTLADNNSSGLGGGICNFGSATLTDDTVSGNSAARGGGLYNAGTSTVADSTVSANSAIAYGGGDYEVANATGNIANTIIAGNSITGTGGDPDVDGSFAATDHDLIGVAGDATGFTTTGPNASLVGTAGDPVNPQLRALGDYGGATATMVPLSTSAALNAGDATPAAPFSVPSTDQRGLPRLNNGVIDIGATQHTDLVTSSADDGGDGTLRSVMAEAAPGETITFQSGISQINLAQGPIEINSDLTVDGPGAASLTIQVAPTFAQIFKVDRTDTNGEPVSFSMSGVTLIEPVTYGQQIHIIDNNPFAGLENLGTLSLNGVTFSGCTSGGLYNAGTATLTNCELSGNRTPIYNVGHLSLDATTISDNTSYRGGGLYNQGQATVTDCTISGNTSDGGFGGGGVYNLGSITIVDSVISGNHALFGSGGGIYSYTYGTLTLQGSTVSGNDAGYQGGGGIDSESGNATLTDSTISNNSVIGSGGGIENGGNMTLSNCTIAANAAKAAYGLPANGGGIENSTDGLLIVNDCTISGNSADGIAGGVDNSNDSFGESLLANTIVAANHAGGSDPDVAGDFSDLGFYFDYGQPSDHDLIGVLGDATGFSTSGPYASLVGTASQPLDAGLGALANNGGATQTMALLPDSAAIDAGDNSPPTDIAGQPFPFLVPATDQRGYPRIVNDTVDIGAFETQIEVTASPQNTTVSAFGTATFTAAALGSTTPSVQWQQSSDGGNTWNPIPGATDTTLALTDVQASSNGYQYEAVFSNAYGSMTTTAATLTVNPVTPTIVSVNPVNITYGTALDNAQLGGTATFVVDGQTVSVPGTFSYTSAAGTMLNAGAGQTENVTFTPTDTADYTTATGSVTLTVNPYAFSYTIGNDSQAYGIPANLAADLPATVSTGVNGQTLDITYASTGDTAVAVPGVYEITGTLGNGTGLASNYNVTLVSGLLTVEGPGASVVGGTLYLVAGNSSGLAGGNTSSLAPATMSSLALVNTASLVGGNTNDQVHIQPIGASKTGATGIEVDANLNNIDIDHQDFGANPAHPITSIVFSGFGGNDNITFAGTLSIPAVIVEGNGNDNVELGNGNNSVTAGNGNDNIQAGNGSNTIVAGNGNDHVQFGDGNNTVTLGNGNDTVHLGDGNNIVVAGSGNDNIQAGNGDNLIVGGLGHDNLVAGNGENILIDGSVALSQDVLGQVLNDWIADDIADVQSILSPAVTFNRTNTNTLVAGKGLDWFWDIYGHDHTNRKTGDLLN